MIELGRPAARPFLRTALLALTFLSIPTPAALAQTPTKPPDFEAPLKPGDSSVAVEDLQRRLNDKVVPKPNLDVDGVYGESTKQAVARFQGSKGMPPSGVADAATRKALGTEKLPEPEVPAPEVVNAEVPVKKPAEPLDGPPFVSAKAWAIVDGRTGDVLWGNRQDESLPMASTTKMMTALVIAGIIDREPGALREVVTFSDRADRTPGSSANLHAGEKVPVEELLYGMMLPSGNDATVAFAEHFGGRLGGEADGADPVARFVAEMNRTAAELGLRGSHFVNTHGLTAREHHATAADLAKMAKAVLANPTLARVVSTVKRGCTIVDAEGKARNVVWENTNSLLDTEGYDGVKTGTTDAAGRCLVASGRRGDGHLIVVILGAPTNDARYLDARNLFRWAWLNRAGGSTGPGGR